ncbi:hypothetical protein MHH81_08845 [Psychrobacillus sp. FSL H8-0484]|uniref:hypothetical protein n=1 Tax=Psychrobacillus sp. FSL H8-0484 TaxID=2921390 RepID=UPI0030FB96CB
MKKFYATFVLLLCSLILGLSVSAQELKSSEVLTYHGEDENWVGKFTIGISEEGVTRQGYLKYKGEDVVSVGQVSVTFETIFSKSSSKSLLAGLDSPDSPIGEKGTVSTLGKSGNAHPWSKVEAVRVYVEWDGKAEMFFLYK